MGCYYEYFGDPGTLGYVEHEHGAWTVLVYYLAPRYKAFPQNQSCDSQHI